MADQIEVPKLVEYVLVGPEEDEASVTKLVMYVFAFPGEGAEGETQGHVHTQIVRRS